MCSKARAATDFFVAYPEAGAAGLDPLDLDAALRLFHAFLTFWFHRTAAGASSVGGSS